MGFNSASKGLKEDILHSVKPDIHVSVHHDIIDENDQQDATV